MILNHSDTNKTYSRAGRPSDTFQIPNSSSVQFISVSQSCLTFCDPMYWAFQASLSIANSQSLLKLISIKLVLDHPTILSFVLPFSSCLQSFPGLGSFPMNQFFASTGQGVGASALALILPMTIQDWFPWGLTGLISLQFKGLSRVCSNSTVKKHQFFSVQLSLWSNSHIHIWLLEKP